MKIHELFEAKNSGENIRKTVLKLHQLNERLKTLNGGATSGAVIKTRTLMFRVEDKLRNEVKAVFSPILQLSKYAVWRAGSKWADPGMDLSRMVDTGSEEASELQQMMAARKAKAASKFILEFIVNDDMFPENIEELVLLAVQELKAIFGESTQVKTTLKKGQIDFVITVRTENLV